MKLIKLTRNQLAGLRRAAALARTAALAIVATLLGNRLLRLRSAKVPADLNLLSGTFVLRWKRRALSLVAKTPFWPSLHMVMVYIFVPSRRRSDHLFPLTHLFAAGL